MNIIFTPIVATTRNLQKRMICQWKRFHSWRHKNALFCTIFVWVFLAVAAYTILNWKWGNYGLSSGWSLRKDDSTQLERIKTSLTVIGGIGAIGYLVIKFRERSALERSEADEKLVRAVQQLGDTSPQVRIAGVYALADVADTYEGPYHQRVVDILCGYLRTDRLLKNANGETCYATNKDGTLDYDRPISPDGPVESAVLSIIANHLRSPQTTPNNNKKKTSSGPWSSCEIDLHNATLTEEVDFAGCHFKQLDLRRAKLFDEAVFSKSCFIGYASFEDSSFKQKVYFDRTYFKFLSSFQGAKFEKDVYFNYAKFVLISYFNEIAFAGDANFYSTTFSSTCDFTGSTFTKNADFKKAEFSHPYFRKCTFRKGADFTPIEIKAYENTWVLDADGLMLDGNLEPTFFETKFNIKLYNTGKIIFPEYRRTFASHSRPSKSNGLPEGAVWVDFENPN